MRKVLIAALLAGAAVAPSAAAQVPQNRVGEQHRDQRAPRAGATAAPATNTRSVQSSRRPPVPVTGTQTGTSGIQHLSRVQQSNEGRRHVQPSLDHRQVAPVHHQPRVDQQPGMRVGSPERRIEHRQVTGRGINPSNLEQRRPPVVSRVPRIGTEPPARVERGSRPRPQWNRSWRDNQRYDWNKWRRQHRLVFHMPVYRDPYGWAYQSFTIGWRLWPHYYSSGYWIDDPWTYRLPPAPQGTRWVRYYNDALLVDEWTGEVIDVVHGVFW